VKKSPSLALSVLFFNVYNVKVGLGAARRPPFACSLLQGFADEGRKSLQNVTATPNGWLEEESQIGPQSRLKGRFGRIDTGKKYTEPTARDFFTTD
jgi:hypothetical protein